MNKQYSLYLRAFFSAVKKQADAYSHDKSIDIKPYLKPMIFYGVKAVNAKPDTQNLTLEEAESNFQFAGAIKGFMELLTPAEFMNLFPISKEYQGHKWGVKDYFYTMDYIKTLEPDQPLGDNVIEFLWEYTNWEITTFNVAIMGYMSDLRRFEGKPSLAEEWADMNGIKTYTMHTDTQGKQFIFDKETGKTARVKKPRPKHLKIIK